MQRPPPFPPPEAPLQFRRVLRRCQIPFRHLPHAGQLPIVTGAGCVCREPQRASGGAVHGAGRSLFLPYALLRLSRDGVRHPRSGGDARPDADTFNEANAGIRRQPY